MRQLLLCLAIVAPLSAATPFQASFENSNNGWTVLHGTAVPDASVTYQNRKSMRLEAGTGLDASVRSAPSRSPSASATNWPLGSN